MMNKGKNNIWNFYYLTKGIEWKISQVPTMEEKSHERHIFWLKFLRYVCEKAFQKKYIRKNLYFIISNVWMDMGFHTNDTDLTSLTLIN